MSVDYWVGQSHLPPRNQTSISEVRLKDFEAFFAKNQKVQIRAKRGLCGRFQYGDGQPAFDAAIEGDYEILATITATPTGQDVTANAGFDYQYGYDYFYAVPVNASDQIQWEWHTSSSSSSWQIYPYFYMTHNGQPTFFGDGSVPVWLVGDCRRFTKPPIFHYIYDRPGWSENLWPIKEDTDYITAKHLDDLVAAMQHIDASFVPRQTHGFVNNLREMENFLDAITIEDESSFGTSPPIYARQHRAWWSGTFPSIDLTSPQGSAWVWHNVPYWGVWTPVCGAMCAITAGCNYASYPLYDLSVQDSGPPLNTPETWTQQLDGFPSRGEWDKTALGAARINLIRNVMDHLRIEALTGEGFRKAYGGCASWGVIPDDGGVRTGFWTGPCGSSSSSSSSSTSSTSGSPSSISSPSSPSSPSPSSLSSPSSITESISSKSSVSPSSMSSSSISPSSPSSLGVTSESSKSTASSPSSVSVSESSPSSISVSESSPSSFGFTSESSPSSLSSFGFTSESSPSSLSSVSSVSESPSSASTASSPSSLSSISVSESSLSSISEPSSMSSSPGTANWRCTTVVFYTNADCTNAVWTANYCLRPADWTLNVCYAYAPTWGPGLGEKSFKLTGYAAPLETYADCVAGGCNPTG